MLNSRQMNIQERLKEVIIMAERSNNVYHRKLLACEALGAVNLAAEYNLINITEWENFVSEIFRLL